LHSKPCLTACKPPPVSIFPLCRCFHRLRFVSPTVLTSRPTASRRVVRPSTRTDSLCGVQTFFLFTLPVFFSPFPLACANPSPGHFFLFPHQARTDNLFRAPFFPASTPPGLFFFFHRRFAPFATCPPRDSLRYVLDPTSVLTFRADPMPTSPVVHLVRFLLFSPSSPFC